MSVKLHGISFGTTPRIPGVRPGDLAAIDCDNPSGALRDWKIIVRSQSIFIVSPPGWLPSNASQPSQRNPKGAVVVHEVPRSEVYLEWRSDELLDMETFLKSTAKHETPPLGWKPAPIETDKPILAQIPQGQVGDA